MEINQPYLYLGSPKPHKINFLIILLNVIFLCIIILETIVYFLNRSPIAKKISNNTPVSQTSLLDLSLIKNTADSVIKWIESQKEPSNSNYYFLQKNCQSNTDCQLSSSDSRIGLTVAWAYFNHYLISGDKNDINQIENILTNYEDIKTGRIQNNFYACKWLWQIYQNPKSPESLKEKAKNTCLNKIGYYPTTEKLIAENPQINDKLLFNTFQNKPADISYFSYNSQSGYEDNNLIDYSAYASDHVFLSKFSNNPKEIDSAKTYFSAALDQLNQIKPNSYINGRCILAQSALDIYQATQDNLYFQFVVNFLSKQGLDSYSKYINKSDSNIPSYFQKSAFEITTCANLYRNIFNITQKKEHQDLFENLSIHLVSNLLKPEAFYSQSENSQYYSVKENSLAVENLFLNLNEN